MKNNFYKIGIWFLFIVFAILVWWRPDLGSGDLFSDMYFHLATAKNFAEANGPLTWGFWESLPLGRAQTYPPLYHILLAFLFKLGIEVQLIEKIAITVALTGGGLLFVFGLAKIFDYRIAFFSLLFPFLSIYFWRISAMVIPATLVLFLIPWLFYMLKNQKWFALGALLTFIFYLHRFLPFFVIAALFLFCLIYQRKDIKWFLLSLGGAFLAYFPWLFHIFKDGKQYIPYLNGGEFLLPAQKRIWVAPVFDFLFLSGIVFYLKS